MDRIHRKTAIAKTGEFILAAHEQGENLLWGRYENQLPLCGFTANGLNCRKCLNGPCRINPFGDEPSRGVCGADRDQIVMENLFQTTLEGVLETARTLALMDADFSARELPDFTPDLPKKTQEKLLALGLLPARKHQLFEVQNSYFSHKKYLPSTLLDLCRLGLIHYGLLKEAEKAWDSFLPDFSPFDPEGANILVVGQLPLKVLRILKDRAEQIPGGKRVNLLGQGSRNLPVYASIADHGTPELALAMNLDALILGPNAHFPALEDLAPKWDVPIILLGSSQSPDEMIDHVLKAALQHHSRRSYLTPFRIQPPDPGLKRTNPIYHRGKEVEAAMGEGGIPGIWVIIGENQVKQTFFERTLYLIERGLDHRLLVLVGGDLAAQSPLLQEELSKKRKEKFFAQDGEPGKDGFLFYFSSFYEIPKVVSFLKGLTPEREFHRAPVVISFPEFFRASTWAAAVSFLSLGFAVQIGIRLPFWGSPALTPILLKDWPAISGGSLLASPSPADGPTQFQEISSFLKSRNPRK